MGKKIGLVEEVDLEKGELAWGEFLCIRVTLDILKPLLRGTKFSMWDRDSFWVRFSYERLPNFCYWCSWLGHRDRECGLRRNAAQVEDERAFPYGAWLRATSYGDKFNVIIHEKLDIIKG